MHTPTHYSWPVFYHLLFPSEPYFMPCIYIHIHIYLYSVCYDRYLLILCTIKTPQYHHHNRHPIAWFLFYRSATPFFKWTAIHWSHLTWNANNRSSIIKVQTAMECLLHLFGFRWSNGNVESHTLTSKHVETLTWRIEFQPRSILKN